MKGYEPSGDFKVFLMLSSPLDLPLDIQSHLLRRCLEPQNMLTAPSQVVIVCLGCVNRDSKPIVGHAPFEHFGYPDPFVWERLLEINARSNVRYQHIWVNVAYI